MTAESHNKYLFDNDFGVDEVAAASATAAIVKEADEAEAAQRSAEAKKAEEAIEEAPPPPPTYSEEDIALARKEGEQAGRDEATRDMASAMEQRVMDTLDAINTKVTALFDAYAKDKEEHSRNAVGVATVIVRKLFPALNMDKAMDEIEHMIIEAMKRTSANPALIVRVPKDMLSEVEEKAQELAALRGREGTLKISADKDMVIGDVAVDWEGGGMSRDTRLIWQEIDEIIERNLGQKLDNFAAPEAEAVAEPELPVEQLVVNPAEVGKNEGNAVESSSSEGDSPENLDIIKDTPED